MNCWRTEFFADMKSSSLRLFVLTLVGAVLAACCVAWNGVARAAAAPEYKLTSTMKLGGEDGWDYVTLDAAGKFLYVTRTTHTMVLDVATGKAVHDIAGQVRSLMAWRWFPRPGADLSAMASWAR